MEVSYRAPQGDSILGRPDSLLFFIPEFAEIKQVKFTEIREHHFSTIIILVIRSVHEKHNEQFHFQQRIGATSLIVHISCDAESPKQRNHAQKSVSFSQPVGLLWPAQRAHSCHPAARNLAASKNAEMAVLKSNGTRGCCLDQVYDH